MKTVPCHSRQDTQLLSLCQWRSLKLRPASTNHSENHGQRRNGANSGFPISRHKHSVCRVGDSVYVVGGKDRSSSFKDIWKFHIRQQEWHLVCPRGSTLPILQGHSAVAHKRLILIFGGTFSDSLGDIQLWIFNTDLDHIREVWIEPGTSQPTCRRDHSAVIHNNNMYVYGGFVDSAGSSQEFWAFSIEEEEWTQLSSHSQNQPGKRHGHSAVVANNTLWLYGGMSGLTPLSDLWRYNFLLHTWQRVKGLGSSPPLSAHTANVVHNHMILIGGNIQGKPVADVWLFNFETTMWQKLQTSGPAVLPALCYHASVSYDQTENQSTITRSTPHLKPAAKYQLRGDRFVVRPRSSPSVSRERQNYARDMQRRQPQRLDRKLEESTDYSGEAVPSTVDGDAEGKVSSQTVNSCHQVDVRIQGNMKEPLLKLLPGHPTDGAGDFTSPFLLNKVKHSPIEDEQRLDMITCSSGQTFCAASEKISSSGLHDSESRSASNRSVRCSGGSLLESVSGPDVPGVVRTESDGRHKTMWHDHRCWDDLFIEDLEAVDQSGVEDVAIYYPSRNPFLPPSRNDILPVTSLPAPHSSDDDTSVSYHYQQLHYKDACTQVSPEHQGRTAPHTQSSPTSTVAGVSNSSQISSPQAKPNSQQITDCQVEDCQVSESWVSEKQCAPARSSNADQSLIHLSSYKRGVGCDVFMPHAGHIIEAETSFSEVPSDEEGRPFSEQTVLVYPHNHGRDSVGRSKTSDQHQTVCPHAGTRQSDVTESHTEPQSSLTKHSSTYARSGSASALETDASNQARASHDARNRQGNQVKQTEPPELSILVIGGRTEEMGSLYPKPLTVWKGVIL